MSDANAVNELSRVPVRYRPVGEAFRVVATARGVKRVDYATGSTIPIIDQGQSLIAGYTDNQDVAVPAGEYVVFGDHTRAVKWVDFEFAPGADGTKVLQAVDDLLPRFAYYALGNLSIPSRGYNRHWTVVRDLRIPVPSLAVQREVVRILDRYTTVESELEAVIEAERDARSHQHAFYRDRILTFSESEIDWVTIPEISKNLDSRRRPVTKGARIAGEYPYYGASGIVDFVNDFIFDGDYLLVSEDGANLLARSTPIAFSVSGKAWVNNHAHILEFESEVDRRFADLYLNSIDLSPYVTGAAQPKLSQANLNKIPIPWPQATERHRVVDILDNFASRVNELRLILSTELGARRRQYEHYRDRLLTFEEVVA